jgi:hypothetical protein
MEEFCFASFAESADGLTRKYAARELCLAVFEELDLPQTLPGLFKGLVRPAEIFALTGDHLVAAFDMLDHGNLSK